MKNNSTCIRLNAEKDQMMGLKSLEYLVCFIVFFTLLSFRGVAQEYPSLKEYQKVTGRQVLQEGTWLRKDRRRNKNRWKAANTFNLSLKKGFYKYETIGQIRDFYTWFDGERIAQGRHFKSAGIAGVAAKQLSKVDHGWIRFFIVRNKEVVRFVRRGSKQVFEFSFPLLRERYFSKNIMSPKEAVLWDHSNGIKEQCQILDTLYQGLSPKAFHRLEKMAKGEGVFFLGVPKSLRFEGDLLNCNLRFTHGITKILNHYLSRQ